VSGVENSCQPALGLLTKEEECSETVLWREYIVTYGYSSRELMNMRPFKIYFWIRPCSLLKIPEAELLPLTPRKLNYLKHTFLR